MKLPAYGRLFSPHSLYVRGLTLVSVEASWEGRVVVRHDCLHWKYAESLQLDHYPRCPRRQAGSVPWLIAPAPGPSTQRVPGLLRRAVVQAEGPPGRAG